MMISLKPSENGLLYIRNNFEFDKNNNKLYRRQCPGSDNWIVCSSYDTKGYLRSGIIDNRQYKTVMGHNIIWYLVYGEWPNEEIDHINEKPWDNSLSNLRLAPDGRNKANVDYRRKNKLHGVYHPTPNRWKYNVRMNGEIHQKYGFHSEFEAMIAREALLDGLGDKFAKRNDLFWVDGG